MGKRIISAAIGQLIVGSPKYWPRATSGKASSITLNSKFNKLNVPTYSVTIAPIWRKKSLGVIFRFIYFDYKPLNSKLNHIPVFNDIVSALGAEKALLA